MGLRDINQFWVDFAQLRVDVTGHLRLSRDPIVSHKRTPTYTNRFRKDKHGLVGVGWVSAWEDRRLTRPSLGTNPENLGIAVAGFSLTTSINADAGASVDRSSGSRSFPVDSIGVLVPPHFLQPPRSVDELLIGDVAFCVPWHLELDGQGRCFFGGAQQGSRAIWTVDVPFPADPQAPVGSPWQPADVGIAMTEIGLAVGLFANAPNRVRLEVGVMERATAENPNRHPATPIALVYVDGIQQPRIEGVGVVPETLRYPILFSAPGTEAFMRAPSVP